MKNNKSVSNFMEIFWLIVFILSLTFGLFKTITSGFSENYMFFVISTLSILLYLARKSLRKNNRNKD